MEKIILLSCTILLGLFIIAQTAGDYRSFQTGNWSSSSTWERFDGNSFVPSANAPANTDGIITIITGHNVTVNSTVTADQIVIDAVGTLTQTANKINVKNFEVQRSENGQAFKTIGTVLAGGSVYSFPDINSFTVIPVLFYRLKSVNIDGRFTYSNIIKLSKQTDGALTVYPKPVKDVITISGLK